MDKKQKFILITFLLGVFMGAIDAGIVSPALNTITRDFAVDYKWSVWVITIYTLVYAVSMPIVSRLADIYGRKKVFIIGIALFGLGSLLSGLAQSMTWLLLARGLQAIGGGGIMPIANSVIGQSFPREKRGMALGLVGATFGVATIIAPNLGGFIIDNYDWRWIFFINIPIAITIILMAMKIPDQVEENNRKLDWVGSLFLSAIILSLMYGLTNLETNNFIGSLISPKVWPFLLASLLLLIPFILIEKRMDDPIIKLHYFKDKNIVLALIISFITGVGMISIIFVPGFSETLLQLSEGKGGYIMTILAVASGVSAGLGGVLLDKWGAKRVVILGFLLSMFGSLVLAFVAQDWNTLTLGLILAGFGVGFTMGAPLNYIILELTPSKESSVALSLVSLFRSIGMAIGPIMLAGFVSGAASEIPNNLQTDLEKAFGPNIPSISMDSTGSEMMGGGSFSIEQLRAMLPSEIPNNVKDQIIDVAQASIQNTMLQGYTELYVASTVVFVVGIIFALLLKLPKRENGQAIE